LPPTPEPTLPELPASEAGRCIGPEGDVDHSPVYREILHYQDAWLARATARRGWTALPPARQVIEVGNSTRRGYDFMIDDAHLRAVKSGLLQDERGHFWLKTRLRFQCSRDEPRFYRDADLGVFEVEDHAHCVVTRDVKLCGVYLEGGCGTNPGPQHGDSIAEWWFVEVPDGGHWLGVKEVAITDDVPVCVHATPAAITTPP